MNYNKYIEQLTTVSNRINSILSDNYFELSEEYFKFIHYYLFNGIYPDSGEYRTNNFTKNEITLNENSVIYADYRNINKYLKYDIEEQSRTTYSLFTKEKQVKKITDFTTRIWTTHAFNEGNTRTITVFIQKYLRFLGYHTDNSIFKDNSRYFRNALVKASYYNNELNIYPDNTPLIVFFNKIMVNPNIELNEDSVYVNELFKPLEISNYPSISSTYTLKLLKDFINAYDLPKDIDLNASGIMQYFLKWLEELKINLSNYATYLSSLNLSLKNYYLCEVGKGHYDSLLYNSTYHGIILSPYSNGFNHHNGNIIVNGNLEFINNIPLIVPANKERKTYFPVDLGINTFMTENISDISKLHSWIKLKDSNHSFVIGSYGNINDTKLSNTINMLESLQKEYPSDCIIYKDVINNTNCTILASKKLIKKK